MNTLIQKFENDLVALVNNSPIPIACKKQVIANVFHEVEKATRKAIEQEAAEEATTAENQEETENE